MPAKANPTEQREFYNDKLQPLMQKAKDGGAVLLFTDASHFVMGCDFLGYIYGKTRRFIKTCSGRKRYNVLGALNFATKKVTTFTNDMYINAECVCALLKNLAEEYAGSPIYIVLDNASYQRCKLVKSLANKLGINLVYLPTYSPNLNLIERLWKHVKKQLRTKYHEKFAMFKGEIDLILNNTNGKDKAKIDLLIGEKVQFFDDCIIIDTRAVLE